MSAKQKSAMTARRTCPECKEVGSEVVQTRCAACWKRQRQAQIVLRARTCVNCYRIAQAVHPGERAGRCVPCWLWRRIREQTAKERPAVWARTCPGRGCRVVTSTDEEIESGCAAGTWRGPRWCPPCAEKDERERAEQLLAGEKAREQAADARRSEELSLVAWAREVLGDPNSVVLDTETTGRQKTARIVEISVQAVSGEVLLDTLVDPGEPIPVEATAIVGITSAMVPEAGVPAFTGVVDRLAAVLAGKRVVLYNKAFDVGRLRYELTRYYAERVAGKDAPTIMETGDVAPGALQEPADATAQAAVWIENVRFEDAMDPYSVWVGDWSDYWDDCQWQPLPEGDHRALGDCCAVVKALRRMAKGRGFESPEGDL
ncbi:3'-5' exonuclease [Streptomyces sp. NPDC007901]|uniref:3'-5' exonuclease n=1 Tax=Streptomyces sp. NPDC007901 TaxID=3364785 RepID=UPI0036E27E36